MTTFTLGRGLVAALGVAGAVLAPLTAQAWPHGPGGLPVPVIVPGPVYVPAPVYVPPPVYVAPQVYAPEPVYAPGYAYDPYIVNVAPADVFYLNGDTYFWAVDANGRRYRRFYGHGDRRNEVYHRQEYLHREMARNGGHLPERRGVERGGERGVEHRGPERGVEHGGEHRGEAPHGGPAGGAPHAAAPAPAAQHAAAPAQHQAAAEHHK